MLCRFKSSFGIVDVIGVGGVDGSKDIIQSVLSGVCGGGTTLEFFLT